MWFVPDLLWTIVSAQFAVDRDESKHQEIAETSLRTYLDGIFIPLQALLHLFGDSVEVSVIHQVLRQGSYGEDGCVDPCSLQRERRMVLEICNVLL